MGIVIATFIIAAVYVGFYASQEIPEKEEAESHSIEPSLLDQRQTADAHIKIITDQRVVL